MLQLHWKNLNNLDFEYQKYKLLAFAQKANTAFEAYKIYPYYQNSCNKIIEYKSFLESLKVNENKLSKKLKGIDLKNKRLIYQPSFLHYEVAQVSEIIAYALPILASCCQKGEAISTEISNEIKLFTVGIQPQLISEGYFCLNNLSVSQTKLFQYQSSIYISANVSYKSINTKYLGTYKNSISTSYEKMKLQLIAQKPELPNPNFIALETKLKIPFFETYLPLGKSMIAKSIA